MAHQMVYKNIGMETEASWGASYAGNAKRLVVTSASLELNPNKALVEDTSTSVKGRDRMTLGRNEIDGDINGFASPKVLHEFFQMVNGSVGSTAASGSSAMVVTYNQNTDNNVVSRTITLDRNNSQEKFSGVRASELKLSASDNLVEASLSVMAKSRVTGLSLAEAVGETVKPLEFADITVTIAKPGYTQQATVQSANWEITYNNGLERSHLSGSRDAARMDIGMPSLSGSIEIFHDGVSYVSPTYGASELYVRIEGTWTSGHGLIAGVTPYYMRIDIPRVEFTTNTRPYEQASLAKETINFTAMFNAGTSALWTPQLTAGLDLNS